MDTEAHNRGDEDTYVLVLKKNDVSLRHCSCTVPQEMVNKFFGNRISESARTHTFTATDSKYEYWSFDLKNHTNKWLIGKDWGKFLRRHKPAAKDKLYFSYDSDLDVILIVFPEDIQPSPVSDDSPPTTVACVFSTESVVKSLDFHPLHQTLLLVGTNSGDVVIWDLMKRQKISDNEFSVWRFAPVSQTVTHSFSEDPSASVKCVKWSPDGSLVGVGYSKYILQVYSYSGPSNLSKQIQIEAHPSVNDVGFLYHKKQLFVVTCGDDKLIKVWDSNSGERKYYFKGHESPVYSLCLQHKEAIQGILSTASDGQIKLWVCGLLFSIVNVDAPSSASTTMAYSVDGSRLFSCGTRQDGTSFLVEWNKSKLTVKRTFTGLDARSVEVVQFHTTDKILAVGHDHAVKFWLMNDIKPLTYTNADGGLPASPCIRFNQKGMLMAVSTTDGFKILANADGFRLLRIERSIDTSGVACAPSVEVNNMPLNILSVTYPGPSQTPAASYSLDDLPKNVVSNLDLGSSVVSMDFHPSQHFMLLVGTNIGDVSMWEVGSRERLVYRNFKVWELSKCSVSLQVSLASEYSASVNRVMWSPDGALFGVAYSKNIVHVYSYLGGTALHNHLEIDAHAGNVSDLAFAHANTQLCVITCGEDKTVKVWDAASGSKLFTFEGHEAPVYSVCPLHKENIQFIFSTAVDGKVKAWLYDNQGSRADYDAPGRSCMTRVYTADGRRLFSCGTNKEGEPFIVEWEESEGTIKRSYMGLGKSSVDIIQFDTMNKFLAVGDEFVIKFWDVDNVNLLTTIDAEGGLPASSCIEFNKEGNLLAVSTSDNGIKVLASMDGVRLMRSIEYHIDSSCAASGIPVKVEPSEVRSLRLPDDMSSARIVRLMYTSCGGAVLALAYDGSHKLWKWERNKKATASVAPHLWTPKSGIMMTNTIGSANLGDAVPCFALSKNDSYVISASGGIISLFNRMTFKTMTTFMPPPPAATALAFHPQDNNIIVIGMENSTIQIYDVRADKVKSKLKGHKKRVTGLAFSNVLGVLVSSGADSQLCVWRTDGWEKQASKFLLMSSVRAPNPTSHTKVQFQQDQIHVLAVHRSQVAIYEAPKLESMKQWFPPRESSGGITDAVYSCDGQSIYVSFEDGSVYILGASTLALRCIVKPAAYLPSNPSARICPLTLAAHPSEPNQFALGLSDGLVHVLEPLESDPKWGTQLPSETGAGPSASSATAASDQPSR